MIESIGYHRRGFCDALCQRALLNGAVDAIIMARVQSTVLPPGDDWMGTRYRLDKASECGEFPDNEDLPEGGKLDDENRSLSDITPRKLLIVKAGKGHCIVSEQARIADADAVLMSVDINQGLSSSGAGLNPFSDTLDANRLSLFTRKAGRLVEDYRSTSVRYLSFLPVLVPFDGSSAALISVKPHWYRVERRLDLKPFAKGINGTLDFARKRLGFDLLLHDSKAQEDMRDIILDALNGEKPMTSKGQNVLDVFFDGFSEKTAISPEDLALSLRVLGEERVPLASNSEKVVRLIVKGTLNSKTQWRKLCFRALVLF